MSGIPITLTVPDATANDGIWPVNVAMIVGETGSAPATGANNATEMAPTATAARIRRPFKISVKSFVFIGSP